MDFGEIHTRIVNRATLRHRECLCPRLTAFERDQKRRRSETCGRDDRYLAAMVRAIFQAGFQWQIIDRKWPDFERAFHRFDIGRNAMMSDEDFDGLLRDRTIVRHGAKIAAVNRNAIFLSDLAQEHGSAATLFESWPKHDLIGLIRLLRKRGTRLGGSTCFNALRSAGIDTFVPWTDVAAGLTDLDAIDGQLTSLGDLTAAATFFANWSDASGQSIAQLSQLLALSIGPITTPNDHSQTQKEITHV
ncbi:DNA-3-methyladenine glycosylase I [Tateyamaria sp. SN6-1]|uniref:DNA-3-methyladenine glycosylase I n=1 Tax=Tateyamaria sp. SN6-1 TaxID=3092148 RepID=UPI0039F633FE